MKRTLLSSSRLTKQILAGTTDFLLLSFSLWLALFLSSIKTSELLLVDYFYLSLFSSFGVFTFFLMGVYKSVLRYINFSSIYLLYRSVFIIFLTPLILGLILFSLGIYHTDSQIENINLKSWGISFLVTISLVSGVRLLANYLLSEGPIGKKIIIYGAGSAGRQLFGALKLSAEMEPVAFLDRKKSLQGTYIGGVKVLKPDKLKRLVRAGRVDEVLIAIPSAPRSVITEMLKEVEGYSIKVRVLPGLAELAQGKVLVSELKEVDISDLLGRQEIEPKKELIKKNIRNKVVLITGAGGSIGSELSRQVAINNPQKIILLDSNEYALYSIKNELEASSQKLSIFSVLASVTNKSRMREVCQAFKVDTIYHAAAYKHVSLVEENPFEAVHNNIIGTKISAECAIEAGVETFVLISTDKAVRPTNIMGATKRFAELILQSMAAKSSTKMSMVRFGNVIGSSGSAVPLFQKQIKDGGPVTVTHPDVIRYFMSIPEAAELVLQAGAMGDKGDVFVLDMGQPVKIVELAKRLINLSGMELIDEANPNGDIEIKFTGLKPGEKLFEELLIGDNVSNTEHKRILKAQEDFLSERDLENFLNLLETAQQEGDVIHLKKILQNAISGFLPDEEVVDVVYLQKRN